MKVFALSDLHLDGKQNKPMDVFGSRWTGHAQRVFDNWREAVNDRDCVLIAGDFCWAMLLRDAVDDLLSVSELPGQKLLIRGNHDYWWASASKLRGMLPPSIGIIQNDAADAGPFVVCGSRGWLLPSASDFTQADEKIAARELIRLELSLNAAMRLAAGKGDAEAKAKPIVLMTHFPPIGEDGQGTCYSELIERYPVRYAVYGHLHAQSCRLAFEGTHCGAYSVPYTLVSADHLDFTPKLIAEFHC